MLPVDQTRLSEGAYAVGVCQLLFCLLGGNDVLEAVLVQYIAFVLVAQVDGGIRVHFVDLLLQEVYDLGAVLAVTYDVQVHVPVFLESPLQTSEHDPKKRGLNRLKILPLPLQGVELTELLTSAIHIPSSKISIASSHNNHSNLKYSQTFYLDFSYL